MRGKGIISKLMMLAMLATLIPQNLVYVKASPSPSPDSGVLRERKEKSAQNAISQEDVDTSNNKVFNYDGRTYEIIDMSTTWQEAKELCEEMGGHLVTITSENEQEELLQQLKEMTKYYYWIGATDEKEEGKWVWVTGEEFLYQNWASGEPNNDGMEDYAEMNRSSGRWNDGENEGDFGEFSENNHGFICEWDTINTNLAELNYKNKVITVLQNRKDAEKEDYVASKGASIMIDKDKPFYTDKNGSATLTGKGTITISKDGYVSRTLAMTEFKDSDTVFLEKDSGDKPIIYAVRFGNYDVLHEEYSIDLISSESVTLEAGIKWKAGTYSKVYLFQEGVRQEFSGNTLTMVLSSKFDTSKSIYIVAEDSKGNVSKRGLKFKNPGNAEAYFSEKLNFGKAKSGEIPSSIPLLSGRKVSFDIPSAIPFSFSLEENKVYVTLGIDIAKYKIDEKTMKSRKKNKVKLVNDLIKTDFKDLKDSIKTIKNLKSKYKQMMKHPKGSFAFTADFTCLGFYEGYIDKNNQLQSLDGGLIINPSVGAEWSGPIIGTPLPLFWEAAIKTEIEGKVNLFRVDRAKNFLPTGSIEGTGKVSAGVGVGIPKVAQVSGGGSGNLKLKTELKENQANYFAITGGLGAYVSLKTFLFELKKEWKTKQYTLFEDPSTNSNRKSSNAEFDLYNLKNYKLQSRDYINNTSKFEEKYSRKSALPSGLSNVQTSAIKTNLYPEATPKLQELGNGQYLLVWNDDDTSRSSINRTSLCYSVYNGSAWSEPKYVDADGTSDFSPVLKKINNQIYLVWQNAKQVFQDNDTVETVAKQLDIYCARYDTEKQAFIDITDISNNGQLDMLPCIAGDSDGIAIAWVSNASNTMFSTNNDNSVYMRRFVDGTWNESEKVSSDLNAIDSMAITSDLRIFYSVDTDGDLTTLEDKEIYRVLDGDVQRMTDNEGIDSNVQVADDNRIYWYSNGKICYLENNYDTTIQTIATPATLADDRFAILVKDGKASAIVFKENNGLIAELAAVLYDDKLDRWSNQVTLTKDEKYYSGYSEMFTEDGTMFFVANRSEITGSTGDAEPYGQCDLLNLLIHPSCNVQMEKEVCFDPSYLVAGNDLNLTVTLHNTGTLPVTNLLLQVKDDSGKCLQEKTIDAILLPGETTDYIMPYQLPEDFNGKKITVNALPVGQTDMDTSDNAASTKLTLSDLAVEDMYTETREDGTPVIYAQVVNRAPKESGEFEVKLVEDSVEGKVIETKKIKSLDSLYSTLVCFDYKTVPVNTMKTVYVKVESQSGDTFTGNDSDCLVLKGETKAVVSSITVDTKPMKLSYTVGDPFTTAGMVVNAHYSDGTTKEIKGYTVSPANSAKLTKAGETTVIVTYIEDGIKQIATFKIKVAGISVSKLKITGLHATYSYDGKKKTPGVTVYDGTTKLKEGKEYTLSYKDNVKLGKATITITGKGNYTGTISKTFLIIPSKVTGLMKKAGSTSSITLKWTKQDGVDGYQILDVSRKKIVATVKKASSTTYTMKKLKEASSYSYQVRSFKKIDNKYYYGEYSSVFKTSTQPGATKLTSVKSRKSKSISISWKKVKSGDGYEIQYSRDKKFKSGVTKKKVTKNKIVSATYSGLSKGKTYYIRIRVYKWINKAYVYSNYSSIKKIKVR